MNLPDYVRTVMNVLMRDGFKVFAVGECVRDMLLGAEPDSFELCSDALPSQISACLAKYSPESETPECGPVNIRIFGHRISVTTMRSSPNCCSTVENAGLSFSSRLSDDLRRRDFTVNAMACRKNGTVIDPFNGMQDIAAHTLRTVGSPSVRFSEDSTAILRMIRYSSRLDFQPDAETEAAAFELRENLKNASPEELRDELSAILMCDLAGSLIWRYRAIIYQIIPELEICEGFDQHNPNHCYDILGHICATVDNVEPDLILRLAALLHDIGKPECYTVSESGRGRFYGHMQTSCDKSRTIMTRLHYPQKMVDTVCLLVENHDCPHEATPVSARQWLGRIGSKNVFLITKLKRADCLAHDISYHNRLGRLSGFRREVKGVLSRGDCYSLSAMNITRQDISALLNGKHPENVVPVLKTLLSKVIDGSIPNSRDDLVNEAKIIISEETNNDNN